MERLVDAKRESGNREYGSIIKEYQTFVVVRFLDGTEEPIPNENFVIMEDK